MNRFAKNKPQVADLHNKIKNTILKQHEIPTDFDISDDYGSASDESSGSLEKLSHSDTSNLDATEMASIQLNSDNYSKMSLEKCKQIWRNADAVCFDVDSTVCRDEAIDELARYVGKSKEVAELTKSAMAGGLSFRQALAKRLEIIQPTANILSRYLAERKPLMTDGIKDLIERLHKLGKDVYLVSGGFDDIIYLAADILKIPREYVYANSLRFYYDGTYAGFNKSRPTSCQDGKSRVISMLKKTKGYKNVVMIGDGVTDLEACPPADAFIGFGGNQIREKVRDNSHWFVYSFDELITELPDCDFDSLNLSLKV